MKLANCLAGAALACACTIAPAQQANSDRVVHVATNDPEMTAAIAHVQKTLPGFLTLASNPPVGTEGYKLKVAVTDANGTEHFWVAPFQAVGGVFRGAINNTPQVVRNVKLGQVIEFEQAHISDWGYVRDGKQIGSFTVCVLFSRMPKAVADGYRREHGFTC